MWDVCACVCVRVDVCVAFSFVFLIILQQSSINILKFINFLIRFAYLRRLHVSWRSMRLECQHGVCVIIVVYVPSNRFLGPFHSCYCLALAIQAKHLSINKSSSFVYTNTHATHTHTLTYPHSHK